MSQRWFQWPVKTSTKINFVSKFLPTYICYVGDHLGQAVFAVAVFAGVPLLLLLGPLPLLHLQHRHAGVCTGPLLCPDWLCEDGWRGCEVKRPQHNLQKWEQYQSLQTAGGDRDQQRRPEKSFSLILRMKSKKSLGHTEVDIWILQNSICLVSIMLCLCDNDRGGRHVAMTDDTLLGMEIWRIWRCWNKFSVCESDVCCCLVLDNFDID